MGRWNGRRDRRGGGARKRAGAPQPAAQARPRFFYVDAENVQARGLDRILELGPLDTVIPAYTDQVSKLSFDRVADILATDAEVIPVRVENGGPNYADFQIAVMAVLNAERTGPGSEHIIVSRDRGYDRVVEMAKKMGVDNISRRCALVGDEQGQGERPRAGKKGKPPRAGSAAAMLADLGVAGKRVEGVLECIRSSENRAAFHNALAKRYDAKMATAVYNKVKPGFDAVKAAAGPA